MNYTYIGRARVYDKSGYQFSDKDFHKPADAVQFIKDHGKSVSPYNGFKALFIPTRTNRAKDFAKDLFLPTLFNQALRVENIGLRILAALGAIFLDLITFVPRLCLAPFKYGYDKLHGPHHYNLNIEDHRSQLKIEIEQRNVDGCSNIIKRQTFVYWVRTKALPEDKKLPLTQADYYPETGKPKLINSLSELKRELAQF